MNELLPGDAPSNSYLSLIKHIPDLKGIEGITAEIGLRRGGGTYEIISTFINNEDRRTHICIDPYGNIDYDTGRGIIKADYYNSMRNETIHNLFGYAKDNNYNIIFFNLEDSEFYKRFSDGVPIYDETKQIINNYCLVHVDGQHDEKSVETATLFFIPRISVGGIIAYDNTDYYPHLNIHNILINKGYSLLLEESEHSFKKIYKREY